MERRGDGIGERIGDLTNYIESLLYLAVLRESRVIGGIAEGEFPLKGNLKAVDLT
jgi:hypothetical protein